MRRFITAHDVEMASLAGKDTLYIDDEDVVTGIAREMAEKLGVTLASKPLAGGREAPRLSKAAETRPAPQPEASPPPRSSPCSFPCSKSPWCLLICPNP